MTDANRTGIPTSRRAFAIALTLATACIDHDPCANVACAQSTCVPAFTVSVADEITNQAVPDASAASAGLACTALGSGLVSCAVGPEQATYGVDVSAPGYATKQVQVVVGARPPPDACGCSTSCQSWEPRAVLLAPASP